MVQAIAKESTWCRSLLKFVLIIGPNVRITGIAKHFQLRVNRLGVKQGFKRCFIV